MIELVLILGATLVAKYCSKCIGLVTPKWHPKLKSIKKWSKVF